MTGAPRQRGPRGGLQHPLALLGAASLALGACSGDEQSAAGPSAASSRADAIGGSFQLTDTGGQTVTDATLKGKPYAIFFGFVRCPDVCPTAMARLAQLHRQLGRPAEAMNLVFVSVDPEHDSREDIASFLSMFDVPVIGLTGTPTELDRVAQAYKVYVEKVPLPGGDYTIDHTARILLFDREGRFVETMDATEPQGEALTKLRRLIDA